MAIHRSRSTENIVYAVKYRTPGPGYGLKRSTSVPDIAVANRYRPRHYPTSHRVHDVWSDYWWERRFYGGERFWPHYNFPYKRYWHEKPRTSSLAHYPSLSWTSRFSQYDKLDPVSWRRYRQPVYPFQRWGPHLDSRFELRMSSFDWRLKQLHSAQSFYIKPYQPRIWHPTPSCWPYSYHYDSIRKS